MLQRDPITHWESWWSSFPWFTNFSLIEDRDTVISQWFHLPCQGATHNTQWFITLIEITTWLAIMQPLRAQTASVMTLIVYSWVWEYKCSIYNKTDANVSHKNLAAPSMRMKKRKICIIRLFQIDFHAHVEAAKPHNKQKGNQKWAIIPSGLLNPISLVDHPDPEETGQISPWTNSGFQLWKPTEMLLSGWKFKCDTDFNRDYWKTESIQNLTLNFLIYACVTTSQ